MGKAYEDIIDLALLLTAAPTVVCSQPVNGAAEVQTGRGTITTKAGTISGTVPSGPPAPVLEIFPVDTRSPGDLVSERICRSLLSQGRQIFRYDTFGDEDFWGGALKLHRSHCRDQ